MGLGEINFLDDFIASLALRSISTRLKRSVASADRQPGIYPDALNAHWDCTDVLFRL
jgi:hypothetical protein